MTNKLILTLLTVALFSGCSTINRSNYETQEEYALALIKDCQWNSDVAEYREENSYKAYNAYSANCNPNNNPKVAYEWGFNVKGNR